MLLYSYAYYLPMCMLGMLVIYLLLMDDAWKKKNSLFVLILA
jgi:branched-subunit amino acid transport protein AzlD